jgi:serine/threonine protein kinase/tetratricopeptide (TPR) repeat protein
MTERDVFIQALDIKDPAQRAAFLNGACAAHPDLRAQVDQLLQAHDQAGQFLDRPHPVAGNGGHTGPYGPESGAETAGMVIAGKYKLLQLIGEGGMGSVWMADQLEPVKRRVAVKLIDSERGKSRTILSRFEAERQAIALMDHPNIAKLLDAGTTGKDEDGGSKDEKEQGKPSDSSFIPHPSSRGRPYFVMELVKGVPLTEFCDEHKLSISERLHLFIQICSAVQHAHQKGIIHRDLKPTNILVEMHDDRPVPKVIDFGLAKALSGQPLTERTLLTAFGTVAGTPLYMAPEQAKFNAIDIDTRADIYALGVILYELLTGSTPVERGALKQAALDEILRVIRETEPPTPSKRLSTTQSRPSVAANRHMEPEKLGRFVKGELDWIVMKALAKERDRRYETATGLARDLERFLNHEVVLAGPPSASYRLRKFVRRNRGRVLAAAFVLLALVVGIVGTTWGMIRAEAAQQAEAERAEGERQAKQEALDRQAETQAVLDFVENRVFAAARPKDQEGGLGYDVKLADAVKAGLSFIDKSFPDKPLIEGRLRMTIGRSFYFLGDYQTAMEQYKGARQIFTEHLGPDHRDTLNSMNMLANCYAQAGRFQEALKVREETLRLAKAKVGRDDRLTLSCMNNLANSYFEEGRFEEVLRLREETLQLAKAKLGRDDPLTLAALQNLAVSYFEFGRLEEAIKLFEEALPLEKVKLGPDDPSTLTSMNVLADWYQAAGRTQEALGLLKETLPLARAKFGPDHHLTLMSMDNLASCYAGSGCTQEALKLMEETLQLRKVKFALEQNPANAQALADTLAALGRWDQALAAIDNATKLEPGNDYHLFCASVLRLYLGDIDGYRQSSRDMLKRFGNTRSSGIAERIAKTCSQGPDAVGNFDRVVKLADLAVEKNPLDRWNRLAKGMAEYRAGHYPGAVEVLNRLCSTSRDEHRDAAAFAVLAMSHHRLGRGQEARAALNSAQAILAEHMPDLQSGQLFKGDWDDWLRAEILCREALGLLGDDGAAASYHRGALLSRQGKLAEAAAEFQKALHIRPDWAEAQHNLALVHRREADALIKQPAP